MCQLYLSKYILKQRHVGKQSTDSSRSSCYDQNYLHFAFHSSSIYQEVVNYFDFHGPHAVYINLIRQCGITVLIFY